MQTAAHRTFDLRDKGPCFAAFGADDGIQAHDRLAVRAFCGQGRQQLLRGSFLRFLRPDAGGMEQLQLAAAGADVDIRLQRPGDDVVPLAQLGARLPQLDLFTHQNIHRSVAPPTPQLFHDIFSLSVPPEGLLRLTTHDLRLFYISRISANSSAKAEPVRQNTGGCPRGAGTVISPPEQVFPVHRWVHSPAGSHNARV